MAKWLVITDSRLNFTSITLLFIVTLIGLCQTFVVLISMYFSSVPLTDLFRNHSNFDLDSTESLTYLNLFRNWFLSGFGAMDYTVVGGGLSDKGYWQGITGLWSPPNNVFRLFPSDNWAFCYRSTIVIPLTIESFLFTIKGPRERFSFSQNLWAGFKAFSYGGWPFRDFLSTSEC